MLSKLVPQGDSQTWLHVAPHGFGSSASPLRPCSCAVLESQGGPSVFSGPGAAVEFLDQAGIYPRVHSRLISTSFSYLAGTYLIYFYLGQKPKFPLNCARKSKYC